MWSNDNSYASRTATLNAEIVTFYNSSLSNGTIADKRRQAVQRIKDFITTHNAGANVEAFGSFTTGMFLPSSDIDIAVTVPTRGMSFDPIKWLENLRIQMCQQPLTYFVPQEFIRSANVPVLKVVDTYNQLKMDISCVPADTAHWGLRNSQFIQSATSDFPKLQKLVVVLKEVLRRKGLDNVASGGVSSYVLSLMVIAYLRANSDVNRSNDLGEALLKVLKFYGKDFNYQNWAIQLTQRETFIAKTVMRQKMGNEPSELLSIQEPLQPGKDAARSSHRGVLPMKEAFSRAYDRLNGRISGPIAYGMQSFLPAVFE